MEASQSNSEQPKSIRLYGRLINSFKVIQIIGGIGILIYSIVAGINYEEMHPNGGFVSFLVGLFTFLTSIFALYVVTQSTVAMIDLLSRIEFNTRQH